MVKFRDEYYKRFGDHYVAPWKLVPVGQTDEVTATLAAGEGFDQSKLDRSKIKFVTADGKGVAAKDDGTKWVLTVPATGAGQTIDIFAVYEKNKNRPLTVGKLRVVSYAVQHHTVTLVPVGVEAPDAGELQRKLNAIYAPYGVEFTVKVDDVIKELSGWKGRTFKLEGNGFFTRENADMAEVRKAYQAQKSTPKGSYYVFVLGRADASSEDGATQANGAQGDMPRGQQFGYVFGDGVQDWSWLLAHELGHGVFTLQHLEDGNYGTKGTLGSIANLMNYTRSTELQAFQWNIMSNPAILTALDSDDASKASYQAGSIWEMYKKNIEKYGNDVKIAIHGWNNRLNTIVQNHRVHKIQQELNNISVVDFQLFNVSKQYGVSVIFFKDKNQEQENNNIWVECTEIDNEAIRFTHNLNDFLNFYEYKDGKIRNIVKYISFKKEINPSDALESMLKNTEQNGRFTTYLEKVVPYYKSVNLNTNKNYIIFVNGFTMNSVRTNNEVRTYDFENNYWSGIDALFIARRNAKNCFYASGNMPASTSGHLSIECEGYKQRWIEGQRAGLNFINLLNTRGIKDSISLDVVCHSMGFAYAQGMIHAITRSGLIPVKLCGYYIIAPDSPSCGDVDAAKFEQVWHYGANENNENFSDRDGIATQAPIQGLEQYRSFTPQEAETGFYDRHSISYFKWIFTRQEKQNGYVAPRK